ncbi:glycosyltransferase family 4 protein [Janthinobacterium lividum]|uniref:glycosyltransferase family 4 protein n=1 Tax=Janthinobacterium lividum TaxID=29581 RepID=UPI0014095259|nr:glycosyltransferase family 4 protein [Janthinobacterium lividum]NHQ90903.1 glycosyltransferase family 4 protein [Janthinobacterium lividum]
MKKIIMIGTSFDTMGGISAVVNVYRSAGLFERYPVEYIATHCDGSAFAKLRMAVSALGRFLVLLCSGRVGLLHMHVSSRASFWRKTPFFLLATFCRRPTIVHVHSGAFHLFYERCGGAGKALIRHVFDRASRVVVLSEMWKEWVHSISRNEHVVAIYNPVMLPPLHTRDEAAQGSTVLMLGRLGKPKGTYDLLEATRGVCDEFPSMQLALGGDGEHDKVVAAAAQMRIGSHVHLLGWVTGADKEQALRNARIYVLPSYNEGLPMSVLEAMAAGLPVISTPVGGIPEAISEGVEGFLVPPGDVALLTQRLRLLLANAPLAHSMGLAGRAKIERQFSAAAIVPHIEALYLALGAQPGSAAP